MKKNEKNKVILGQDDSLEPRQGACDAAPKANSAESLYTVMPDLIGHLSRIHLLSLRGAVGDVASRGVSLRGAAGDVAISCVKALSSRGRAESSDVVISCNKALSFLRLRGASGAQGIFAPARVLFKHLSCRFLFNLIRRSLEFFAFAQVAPAKNRDDSLLFSASPHDSLHRHLRATGEESRKTKSHTRLDRVSQPNLSYCHARLDRASQPNQKRSSWDCLWRCVASSLSRFLRCKPEDDSFGIRLRSSVQDCRLARGWLYFFHFSSS